MRITDLLKNESIVLGASPADKAAAINQLADLMEAGGNLSDKEQYTKDVFAREASGTTGLGDGIATPHAKSAGVKAAGLAAMTVPAGMDFESMDGQPSRLFFMIAAPDSANDDHLAILSKLATMIMDPDFKEALIAAKSKDEFLKLIDAKEDGNFVAPAAADAVEEAPKADHIQVLAVTACPTGIAHTFMAAESLEQHAKKRGITIKVETNGSGGAKNVLTAEEIAKADAIIVAADKNVAMARFDGKPTIITKVADGINKADELLDRALSGNAPIYHASGSDAEESAADVSGESLGRQIYKHLMNGVSHMLPFVVGGGILIAMAFLFDDYSIDPSKFGSNTPLAKFFMDIGGASFGFMLPILAGFIAMSIADRPGLAVGFVGGALAGTTGSGFLGALVAGFVAGYAVNFLKKAFSCLPESLDGIKPVLLYPFFGILIIGFISMFIIAPPVGAINTWLVETLKNMDPNARIMLGIVMGGMMAIDMGGPINKAAYVTGTGLLASGEYHVMAAVMAGGMVPPLAIALCTTFFKNRFTESERKAGITNYVMGMSFITEGAIPFAAGDPLRVIPSVFIGSATAGALSMAFDCTLRAPHGGIFVVPTIGNAGMYLAAIIIGAVVGCIVLSVLKKPIKD
ncbi:MULTISPECIES: fructose-specific PTS transporter subunit EIIC [Selenomonas]|uniref:PTS system, fructose-specific IIC component n=1 Tax=Selenomonas ruminantium TaxID=971 RepID=A0A1H3WU09_SELRU|nr:MULTISPECIES: fructose-specific PTS transporter subunit EIIC [Selenomonas]SDZ90613.1 PTS system, fructose-specific IIC component [Selenomonas ruminantium]